MIDSTGTVLGATQMGERTLVVGDVPVREAPHTLMVAWGDWVGLAGVGFLVLLAAAAAWRRARARFFREAPATTVAPAGPLHVAVLPPAARLAAGLLRAFARGSLLWMGAAVLHGEAVQANTLVHIRIFAALFLAPELAAWCVLRAFGARASVDAGALVLTRGARRLELATRDIVAVESWRLPLPCPGAWLRMASGARWRYGLALSDPSMLARLLAAGGAPLQAADTTSRAATHAQARLAVRRGRLDRPWVKFVLFPLALALPAFRLHQHIAYGSAFGEFYTFGLNAYLTTFALWWAEWTIGVVLWAAALRAAIEAGSLLVVLLRPRQAALRGRGSNASASRRSTSARRRCCCCAGGVTNPTLLPSLPLADASALQESCFGVRARWRKPSGGPLREDLQGPARRTRAAPVVFM